MRSTFIRLVQFLTLSLVALSASGADVHAQSEQTTTEGATENQWLHEPRFQNVEIGMNLYQFNYAEQLTAPLKSTESGLLPGLHLGYRIDPGLIPFYFRMTLDYAAGNTTFDGSTQSGQPVLSSTNDVIFNGEGDIAYPIFHFSHGANSILMLYTGMGAHFWQRGSGNSTGGVVDYQENYSWLYVPAGIRFQSDLSDHWSLAADAQARFTFNNQITVFLTDIDPAYSNPNVGLGSKVGYRVEIPVTYRFTSGLGIVFSPWAEYSALGQSDPFPLLLNGIAVGAGQEPNSRTYEFGGTTSVAYRF